MGETEGKAAAGQDLDDSIIVAYGGNLAFGAMTLAQTLEAALAALGGSGVAVRARSRLWRSAAWPDPGEPAFLNGVAIVETLLDPLALLATLHRIEASFGRVRSRPNAPRPLDLDLIAYGRSIRTDAPLLPHPRAGERLFVMGPLAEIAPAWRHPITGARAQDLAASAPIGRDAHPVAEPL
jgi:2-amino-4-hydroxy-6-hydroxymethyldihydropteridine diphosphokinase